MDRAGPAAEQYVIDVLETWPETVPVFLRYRMACPGCAMAPFETVAEAAAAYGMVADELLAALAAAIGGRAGS